jgi:methylated-DNA-[protein]-cysteine S-methyltransferase
MNASSRPSIGPMVPPLRLPMHDERSLQHIKEEVYKMLLKIPAGKVSTYGDIAKALGYPNAARLIGQILHNNPNPVTVPCHRVIHSDGKIGGYAYGKEKKLKLLEEEGLKFSGPGNTDLEEFQKYRVSWSFS